MIDEMMTLMTGLIYVDDLDDLDDQDDQDDWMTLNFADD